MLQSLTLRLNNRGHILTARALVGDSRRGTLVLVFVPSRSKNPATVREAAARCWAAGGYDATIGAWPVDGWDALSWKGEA